MQDPVLALIAAMIRFEPLSPGGPSEPAPEDQPAEVPDRDAPDRQREWGRWRG